MSSYVYMRVNNINGKFYIGKTDSPKRRWQEENRLDNLKKGVNSALERAIKKYGKDNFTNLIIAKCKDSDEAYKVEEELITICRCTQPNMIYNIASGGKGIGSGEDNPFYGCHHTQTAKDKISKAKKEKFVGDKSPVWKPYARVIKCGLQKGKQRYALRYEGNEIRHSVDKNKLLKEAEEINKQLGSA